MQDKVQAYTDIISERGIGNPLMKVTCAAIPSSLFEEGDPVDDDRLGSFQHGTARQRAATGVGILDYDHLQVFLTQICTGCKR